MIGSMKGATAPTNSPTSLSSTVTQTTAVISFTAPTNNGGSAITNYEYSFNNSTWTALSPADATSPVTISGLTGNTSYTIYLRAVNAVGSGPASTGLAVTTSPLAPQNAPTSLSASSITATSVVISFTAPTDNGGSAITNYQYNVNGGSFVALSPADGTTPVSISGLTANTSTTITLKAVNAVGVGPASTGVTFTTSLSPVPVNFFVLAGGGGGGGSTQIDPYSGGGGGAGGLRTSSGTNGGGQGLDSVLTFSSGATATVTVGGGGAGGAVQGGAGGFGANSVFHTITAGGGGRAVANNGGSAGTHGFAGRGGTALGGSGGGVGSASTVAISTKYWGTSYYPGNGLADYVTGTFRGGGGGSGGGYNTNGGENGAPGPSTHGSGGGGVYQNNGGAAEGNRGGGGGGASFYDYSGYAGGAGGSGIVIITYPTTYGTLSSISGLAYSYSVSGSNRIYQFTSGSGNITFPTF